MDRFFEPNYRAGLPVTAFLLIQQEMESGLDFLTMLL